MHTKYHIQQLRREITGSDDCEDLEVSVLDQIHQAIGSVHEDIALLRAEVRALRASDSLDAEPFVRDSSA